MSTDNLELSDTIIYIGLITSLLCISLAYYIALHRFLITHVTNASYRSGSWKKFLVTNLKWICTIAYLIIFCTIISFPILHLQTNDSRFVSSHGFDHQNFLRDASQLFSKKMTTRHLKIIVVSNYS